MMRAFGKYKNGLVVMHMDNYKENNALSNLKMGTNEENGVGNAVQITIQHADGTEVATIYRSESEAARRVGLSHRPSTRTENVNDPTRRASSRRVRGIKFAATDPPPSETSSYVNFRIELVKNNRYSSVLELLIIMYPEHAPDQLRAPGKLAL